MILPYKCKSIQDSGAFYAPYISLVLRAWQKVGYDNRIDKFVYEIKSIEILQWIETCQSDMWESYMPDNTVNYLTDYRRLFTFSEKMETLFLMKWS